jgi:hypothetical protein
MWGFFGFFFIKPHLYCTYVMHISGSFHYLYQFSFFCACHKLEPFKFDSDMTYFFSLFSQ